MVTVVPSPSAPGGLWARVLNGVVWELVELPAGFQPSDIFPADFVAELVQCGNTVQQGWTYTNGTFAAPVPPTPTLAEQALAMLAVGFQVQSTGIPAINGTYATDGTSQGKIGALALYSVVHNGQFPNGSTSWQWPDAAGAMHTFPTNVLFMAFATAIANFVATLDLIVRTGSGTLPTQPTVIA